MFGLFVVLAVTGIMCLLMCILGAAAWLMGRVLDKLEGKNA